jgi:hypothetical protein
VSRGNRPGLRDAGVPGPVAGMDAGMDAGMVTAELAVALPTLILAGLLAVTGIQVASVQLRCLDAAGIAARLAARGEHDADVKSHATVAAPPDAQVVVRRADELVTASVVAPVHLLGLGGLIPALTVSASAAEPVEPGVVSP